MPAADAAERNARKERDLEAADRRERGNAIAWADVVYDDRVFDGGELRGVTRIIDARTATDRELRRESSEDGCERRRRRRVADAHVAEGDRIRTFRCDRTRECDASRDKRLRFVARHRRAERHVVRAPRTFAISSAGCRISAADAGIDDAYTRACLRREHIDGGAAREEVAHHLRCHLRWVGADTGLCDTVVRRRRRQ